MSRLNRRQFNQILTGSAAGAALGAPFTVLGAAKPKVVVIGGGAGGATVAHYLAKSGAVDVTLIEASRTYTSCFFSNLYLGGFRTFGSITHGYDKLRNEHRVTVINAMATSIDADKRQVRLADSSTVTYDRLVVAPGIDFKWGAIDGYDAEAAQVMPHAYKPGTQTQLLKTRMEAMPDGGLFVIAPPPNPFRCPPGPYERASMVAHYFSRLKPKSKILILDAKNKHSKQGLFHQAWSRFYPDMIEWLPADMTDGGVVAVDTKSMEVKTKDETFKVAAANIIPPQTAGRIALENGLANESGWCPVSADDLKSKLVDNVHLVGDAIIPGDMPKSGFSANSQAKVCVNAILADLASKRRFKPRFRNTCWSLVATDHGIKVGANYEATEEKIKKIDGFLSKSDETDDVRAATSREADGWYAGITADMFG